MPLIRTVELLPAPVRVTVRTYGILLLGGAILMYTFFLGYTAKAWDNSLLVGIAFAAACLGMLQLYSVLDSTHVITPPKNWPEKLETRSDLITCEAAYVYLNKSKEADVEKRPNISRTIDIVEILLDRVPGISQCYALMPTLNLDMSTENEPVGLEIVYCEHPLLIAPQESIDGDDSNA